MFRLLIITSQEDLIWHGYFHVSFTDHYFTGRSPLTWLLSCFVHWSLLHRKICSGIGTSLFRLLIITSQEDLFWNRYFLVSFTDHYFTGRSVLVLVLPCFVYWSLLHRKVYSDIITFLFRLLIITSQEDLFWYWYFLVSFIDHYFTGRSPLTWVIRCFFTGQFCTRSSLTLVLCYFVWEIVSQDKLYYGDSLLVSRGKKPNIRCVLILNNRCNKIY